MTASKYLVWFKSRTIDSWEIWLKVWIKKIFYKTKCHSNSRKKSLSLEYCYNPFLYSKKYIWKTEPMIFFISNEYTVVHLWTIRCLQNNCCFCHSALNLCSCLCFSFNCFYQIIFSSKECFKLVLSSSSHNSPFTIILRTTLRFWWRDQVVSLFFIRWPNEK